MSSHRKLEWYAVAVAGLLGVSAQGATINWTGNGSSANINNSGNWSSAYSSTEDLVYSDASVRDTVSINASSNRTQSGSITFGGDAFNVVNTSGAGTGTLTLQNDLFMNSANTIAFSAPAKLENGVLGTGTGTLVLENARGATGSADYTFGATDGSSPFVLVLNKSDGFTGLGVLNTANIGAKVIANNTTDGAFKRANVIVHAGGVLGGSGILTPGDGSNVSNVTLHAGGRLSAGDNYHTGADVDTLTFDFKNSAGRLILDSGSLFTFDLAAVGSSDLIDVIAGGIELNGLQFNDFDFNALSGFGDGVYTLFQSVNTTGSLGANLSGLIDGLDATLALDNTMSS